MKNCVYRFINDKEEIIYIGKAKDLKNRLKTHTHLPKECYEERNSIEYIEFNTEDDIDLAERYFITKLKPKYNTLLKDKDVTINIEKLDLCTWKKLSNVNNINYLKALRLNNEINILNKKIEEINLKIVTFSELYNEDIDSEIIKTKIDTLEKEKGKLENRLHTFKLSLLKENIGVKNFNKLSNTQIELYLKYNTFNDEDTIYFIWEKVKKDIKKDCIKEIDKNGFFSYTKLIENIDNVFVYNKYIKNSHWIELLTMKPNNLGKQTTIHLYMNKMLENIINELEEMYGVFYQDIIVEKVNAIGTGFEYQKAEIIYRLVDVIDLEDISNVE